MIVYLQLPKFPANAVGWSKGTVESVVWQLVREATRVWLEVPEAAAPRSESSTAKFVAFRYKNKILKIQCLFQCSQS